MSSCVYAPPLSLCVGLHVCNQFKFIWGWTSLYLVCWLGMWGTLLNLLCMHVTAYEYRYYTMYCSICDPLFSHSRMAKLSLPLTLVITTLITVAVEGQSKSAFPYNICSTMMMIISLCCYRYSRILSGRSVLPQPWPSVDRWDRRDQSNSHQWTQLCVWSHCLLLDARYIAWRVWFSWWECGANYGKHQRWLL